MINTLDPEFVTVFAPIVNVPAVTVPPFVNTIDASSVTPLLLFTVNAFAVAGKPLPVFCAAVPLYV
jgi:hypothetical protein